MRLCSTFGRISFRVNGVLLGDVTEAPSLTPEISGSDAPALSSHDFVRQPVLWLNLFCLDAPLVAISWQWIFARTFHIQLRWHECAALFLTAWLIYLGDRFLDSLSLGLGAPTSLRQDFCLQHHRPWIALLAAIGAVDAWLILHLDWVTLSAGVPLGIVVLFYLGFNWLGHLSRTIPAKEVTIGSVFAAGVVLVPMIRNHALNLPSIYACLGFAALCSLNCICIARWECHLDQAQSKDSIATRWPRLLRHIAGSAVALAALTLIIAPFYPVASALLLCIASSSILLALLDRTGISLKGDQRVALADLVLLTPLLVLLINAA